MTAIPVPNAAEARDNASYEALMWALARPGEVQRLPEPGLRPVALALVDIETSVFADDPALAPSIVRTGARLAGAEVADYLFVADDPVAAVTAAQTGTGLNPETGATVAILTTLSGGPRLRLTGPGIDGAAVITPALPAEFWAIRDRRVAYPLGFDLFIVEGDRVIGLPRSVTVEVL